MRKQLSWLAAASTVASLLLAEPTAHAIDIPAGGWNINLHGFASGFLQLGFCDHSTTTVQGGFACNTGPAGANSRAAISNGLGVASFGVSADTLWRGWDLGAQVEIWSGINSLNGGKTGFGETSPTMRQAFAFFGRKRLGTIKGGRMFGLFGSDAIANDMTLAGVGSGGAGVSGAVGTSTLGRIGLGYLWPDFFPQIQYLTPDWSGFQITASLIQAFDASPLTKVNAVSLIEHVGPGFMGKATFDWKRAVAGRLWAGGWVQSASSTNGQLAAIADVTSWAADVGFRLDFKGLALVGYFWYGDGVGSTAAMRDGVALVGGLPAKRTSLGYYGQLSYVFRGLKLGVSYGDNNLKPAAGETGVGDLVKSNSSVIAGVYYTLGGVVTIATEWTHTIAENQGGGSINDNGLALGLSAGF